MESGGFGLAEPGLWHIPNGPVFVCILLASTRYHGNAATSWLVICLVQQENVKPRGAQLCTDVIEVAHGCPRVLESRGADAPDRSWGRDECLKPVAGKRFYSHYKPQAALLIFQNTHTHVHAHEHRLLYPH